LKPEFLNRLDDIVIFGPLDLDAITEIVDILFKSIQKKLERGVWSYLLTTERQRSISVEGLGF